MWLLFKKHHITMIIPVILAILILFVLNRIIDKQNELRDNSLQRFDINDIKYRTGDIIFFRHDCPLYFYGSNGINMDTHIIKNISKTIIGFSQKYYSHVGIVIVINNIPYVYHITSNPHVDTVSGKSLIGVPVLVSMSEIQQYKGMLYHHQYIGPEILCDMDDINHINLQNIKLCGNFFNVISKTYFKIGKYKDNEMTCADFINFAMFYFGINKVGYNHPVDLEYIRKFVSKDKNYETKPVIINTVLSKAIL